MAALSVSKSVVLTSTLSSQTTAVPNLGSTLVVYNGAANPVYLTFAATIAIPATGVWTSDIIIVQPSTTQTFANGGSTLAYIASTAGGLLVLSVGEVCRWMRVVFGPRSGGSRNADGLSGRYEPQTMSSRIRSRFKPRASSIEVIAPTPPVPVIPVITSASAFSTPENILYQQTATASGGGTMTWAKGGTDAALVTLNTATGAWSLTGDFETDPSIAFTLTATNSAGSSAPQPVTVTITDVADGPALNALGLSSASYTSGTGSSGTITGATTGETIVLTNGPAGLTINSAARTWTYAGSGGATSGNLTLTGTLAGATNTPNPTVIAYTVAAAAVTLGALGGTFSVMENSPPGTIVGAITGRTTGSSLALTIAADGRFDLSGTNLVTGATPIDYEAATSYAISIRETLTGATNTPRANPFTVTITNDVADDGAGTTFPATINPLLEPFIIALAVAETTYPPQFDITGMDDVLSGDTMWIRRTDDLAGSVNPAYYSHVVTDADLIAAPPRTFNFANPVTPFNELSDIASGSYVYTPFLQRASARSDAGVTVAHGPLSVAPTITSSAAPAGTQFVAGSHALTANQTVTWTITGGADAAIFSISGGSLNYTGPTTTTAKVVIVTATNSFGNATAQTITLSVAANTASAFTFTDETSVPASTVKTSNIITVAGITTAPVPVSVTGGTYSKNGGAYVSTAGTAVNTDTFAVRHTSSAGFVTPVNTVLTIGATSDTYTTTTIADPAAPAKWVATTGVNKHANITISGANDNIATNTAAGTNAFVRANEQPDINAFAFEVTITDIVSAQGPIYIGIDSGAVDYSVAQSDPDGFADTCYFKIQTNLTDDAIYGDAYNTFQTNPANGPATWQDGDVIRVEGDKTAGTVKFLFSRAASAFVQMGTTATLTTMAGWYAVCGGAQAGVMTTDFTGYKA